jgi:hypothetical protein
LDRAGIFRGENKMKTQQLTPNTIEQAVKERDLKNGIILFCIWEGEPVFYSKEDLDNNLVVQCPCCHKSNCYAKGADLLWFLK